MTAKILKQSYLIESELPIIMSATSATAGMHHSVDYLRGACFLGIVAAQLYTSLSSKDAFLVFHSGKVRFLNALPTRKVDKNIFEVSYPVPMSLHTYKGEQYTLQNNYIDSNKVFDTSSSKYDKQRQPVQLRGFNITTTGFRFIPQQHYQLRTAIDNTTNIAAKSQLFGYEANDKNQYYYFSIEADADVDVNLWNKILECIPRTAHIGRSSSSAEYGKINITSLKKEEAEQTFLQIAESNEISEDNQLTLWLVSDMQLLKHGQPTLIPEPELLGLPSGTVWLSDKSFLRSSRFSARNNYRRHYDKERQVISRGSVLRYSLPNGYSDTEYKDIVRHCHAGLGLQRECGFGQVLVDPVILQDIKSNLSPLTSTSPVTQVNDTSDTKRPENSILIAYLENERIKRELGDKPNKKATAIFNELCIKVSQARNYQGLVKGMPLQPLPPKRTQFGKLRELANIYRNDATGLLAFLCDIDVKSSADNDNKMIDKARLNKNRTGMLVVVTEDENTNRQSNANYSNAGWELKYAPSYHACLGSFLSKKLYDVYKEINNEVKDNGIKDTFIINNYFSQVVAELAILGLSRTWEEYCLGIKTMQSTKAIDKEYAYDS
ncbi:type III-B CRISPR module-associated Cmr3 family protein [Psychrobacter sp. I-STPA6b]|uniref:type III-B CRISPR module-associated Cmr3 family protein n=1 Tax=Psychrobacter sp. I-STPA6b TaxID=2585718 RepID=UPI001D0C97B8|nr:type III-B CRISPR module-associated Cmr3 family protein [Psychrobacter sp. I-STPA6b]